MIPFEYKTYTLMVLPQSTWVDTCDDDDDDDDDDGGDDENIMMIMTTTTMMMMRMIVSVEQRPDWTVHI